MIHIVLYEPEIPPNTGNIIRVSANTGFHLHLIEPLGFDLSDRQLKRAGLDYHDLSTVFKHCSYAAFHKQVNPSRIFSLSTHGKRQYTDVRYQDGDALLFGPETRGLPPHIRDACGHNFVLKIPMRAQSRSLNLSNSVSIVAYEAWRQLDFDDFGSKITS